ncbi:MAG: MurR/RpiR family transcriptional regulator [Treponema sp.]|jgi:DNA-binding MurR/RpiR family transcriptional regulator|nr:MurR/RpiR family transcriptional regulator [Treponema sp.]
MDSLLFLIREYVPRLPRAERRAAEYVLAEPKKTLYFNISELAKQSGVSQAAIVRFCRRIGADGFAGFKLRLSHDVFRISDERYLPDLDLEADREPGTVVKNVIAGVQRGMAWLESLSDIHLLNSAVRMIQEARLNHIFGIGASSLAAQDLYQKLLRIGIPATAPLDTDLQITAACNLKAEDTAVVISYSGETPAMLTAALWAKKKGAGLITLTMESKNSLRNSADIALLVPASERVYRTGAMVSRITQLAVIDMLYSLLLSKDLNNTIHSIEDTMEATHTLEDPKDANEEKDV